MADMETHVMLVPLNIVSLSSLVSQLYNLILLWKMNEKRLHNMVINNSLRKQNFYLQKLKKLQIRKALRKRRSCWHHPGRTDLWWKNLKNGVSPVEFWKKNFRLSREKFMTLCDELRAYITPNPLSPNRRSLPAEKKLALTLYYLKDTGSLGMTANTFGIAIPSAAKVVYEVCKAISINLGPKFIHLPKSTEEMRQKVSEFESKYGMVQAFGCVDGTHIPIKSPNENSQDYFSYKQFFSLNVQAVCDYKGKFMDVECKWPGSVHDSKVYANSSIAKKCKGSSFPMIFQSVSIAGFDNKVPNYLIGDPAYPLTPHCMKEYDHCVNDEQVVFNNLLRSARNPIECAFGRLKARWGILARKMDLKLDHVPTVIYSCFVLHNFCEQHNSCISEELVNNQIKLLKENEAQFKNVPDPVFSCDSGEGKMVRETLTNYISTCL